MDRNNQIPRDVGAENGSPGGTRLENKGSSCPLCPNPAQQANEERTLQIRLTILKPFVWFLFCSGLFSTVR